MTDELDRAAAHLEKHELEQAAIDRERVGHEKQHSNEEKALETALDADRARLIDHRVAHEAAHASHEKLHEAFSDAHRQQHDSEQEAVKAATSALNRRLDTMNEIRSQLND